MAPIRQTFSGTQNLNLKDGLIRFAKTYADNPFQSNQSGFWVDTNNHLRFTYLGTTVYVFTVTSPSVSPSQSPSASVSPSASKSPSVSPSISSSVSPSTSPSVSPSASVSPSRSPSVSPSVSPSAA